MNMIKAIQEKTVYHDFTDTPSQSVITHDYHEAQWIVKAIDILKGIVRSEGDLFAAVENKINVLGEQSFVVKPRNHLANGLIVLLHDQFAHTLTNLLPNYQVNPYLQALVQNQQYFPISMDVRTPRLPMTVAYDLSKFLNCLVTAIRQDAHRPDFKDTVRNFERSANKNHRSLIGYVNGLFTAYSKLLVIRLDLEYRADDATGWSLGLKLPHDQVAADRDIFFRSLPGYLKQKLGKDVLVGFCWKLEYGPRTGWHYHTLVFLDGQKSCEDVTLGQLIGERWMAVTNNQGRYYNCNSKKIVYSRLDSLGIGLIDYRDRKTRKNLENTVAEYLTKVDACVKLKLPEGARSFGRGVTPKPGPKRGRPRSVSGPSGQISSTM